MDATTQNEERRLFASLRADPSPAARDRAFQRYLPLARSLAGRYRHSEEPIEDLEQVAGIGLLKAIDRFDPDRGAAFSSFAVPTILGELRRHFRDTTWALRVPRQLQELTLKIEHARGELTNLLGRQPTVAELSDHLEEREELILQALDLMVAKYTLSLDEPDDDDTPAEPAPGSLDDGYARAEDRATLAPLLAHAVRRGGGDRLAALPRGPHAGRDRAAGRRLPDARLTGALPEHREAARRGRHDGRRFGRRARREALGKRGKGRRSTWSEPSSWESSPGISAVC